MADKKLDLSQLDSLFSKISEGFAYCRIVTETDGKPVDWVYLDVNEAYERINGVKKENVVGKKATEVLPSIVQDTVDWVNLYGKVALTGETLLIERFSEARKKWYHISAFSPQNGYFISIFEDITERKKTEEELRKARDDWESTFDAVPDFIALLDKNHRIIRANSPMAKQLGVTPEMAVGLKCFECVHGTDCPPENCPHAQTIQDNQPHIAEVHEPRLGGDFIVTTTPVKDKNGQLIGSIHVARDITKRKQAEEALKQSEEKYRSLFANMMDGFAHCQMVYDAKGEPIDFIYLDVNDAFERLTGLKKEKVLGKKVSEAIPGTREANPELIETYGRVAATGKEERFEINFKPLKTWFAVSVYSEQKGFFVAVFEDVTNRKQAEEALRQNEQRWSTTLSSIGDAVIATDTEGKVTFMNAVSEKLTGWKLSEAKGKPIDTVFKIANEKNRQKVCNPVTEVLEKNCVVGLANHTILIRKDGAEIPIDDSGAPIRTQDGRTTGVVLVFRDITQRKKNEEVIRQSEERFSKAFHNNPAAMTISSLSDGKWVDVNEAFLQLTGFTRDEVIGHNSTELHMFDGDLAQRAKILQKLVEGGALTNVELGARAKNGTRLDLLFNGVTVNLNGELYAIASQIDISERKKAEQSLRESEDRLKRSQEIAHLGSWELDLREDKLTWSDEVYRIFGLKPQEFGATYEAFLSYVHPDDRAAVNAAYSSSVQEGKEGYEIEHRVVRKNNGEIRVVHEKCTHVRDKSGRIIRSLGMVHDVTERKRAEEALLKAKEQTEFDKKRLETILEATPSAVVILDAPDGKFSFANKRALHLYGFDTVGLDLAENVAKVKARRADGTDYPVEEMPVSRSLRQGEEVHNEEMIIERPDGYSFPIMASTAPLRDLKGNITAAIVVWEDITERKKVEKEIARLASFPTLNPSPVVEVTADGKVTYVNPATKNLFPQIESKGLSHIFFSDWNNVKQSFDHKSTNTFGREIKIDDRWYHQQFYLVPITQHIRVYTTDINELKQTEEARARAQKQLEENAVMLEEYASQMEELAEQRAQQLQNAERMAAIGQTAGMVGHDIRNPLQAITSDMYIISEEAKALEEGDCKEAIMESIESVNQNLWYINKIVSDLQDYTRPLKPFLQDVDLTELIRGVLLTITVPKGIEVVTDIKEADTIKTDVAYMRRILTNLITNGIQAMQEKGRLTVQVHKKKDSDSTVITVQDTGVGIPEEVKVKMFTPLFTTKSKGQGLGLAVVKRLAEALDGSIDFESEEGKGTKFTVEFPQ